LSGFHGHLSAFAIHEASPFSLPTTQAKIDNAEKAFKQMYAGDMMRFPNGDYMMVNLCR